jgi:hypothetical protein
MKKRLIPLIALFVLATSFAVRLFAQADYITIDSGTFTLNNSNDATPLAAGDVIQLGYFSQATGNFIALSGGAITNTAQTPTADGSSYTTDTVSTVIGGDQNTGAGPGQFVYTLVFNLSTPNLPSDGQIMSLLFFNGASISSSSAYGGVSNSSWVWENATSMVAFSPDFSIDASTGTLTWLGADSTQDVAYTGVPEPTTFALFGASLLVLLGFSRRGK